MSKGNFNCKLDHLVVAALDLAQGMMYVRDQLGVTVPLGGRHVLMGTHNRLMCLGNGVYLEIIAVDHRMKAPSQPRWFGLDDPQIRNALQQSPRLMTWAINTSDLAGVIGASQHHCGKALDMQRDNLHWRVAFPGDGSLPAAGFLPLTIQWQTDFHPSERMAYLDCRFKELILYHPRVRWLTDQLTAIKAANLVTMIEISDRELPFLVANIETPSGMRSLSSKAG